MDEKQIHGFHESYISEIKNSSRVGGAYHSDGNANSATLMVNIMDVTWFLIAIAH